MIAGAGPRDRRALWTAAALCLAAALTLWEPACAREVLLRAAYPQLPPSAYSLGIAGKGTLSLADISYDAELTAAASYTVSVAEVLPEGDSVLSFAVSEHKLAVTLSGEALPPPPSKPVTFTLYLSPLGRLLTPVQTQAQPSRTSAAAAPGESPSAAAAETEAASEPLPQLGLPAAVLLTALALPPLPEQPVHEGSAWEGESQLPLGNDESLVFTYKGELKQFGTVQGVDAAYLTVHYTIPAPTEIPAWSSAAVGQWEGTMDAIVAVSNGRVLQAVTHGKIELALIPLSPTESQAADSGGAAGAPPLEQQQEPAAEPSGTAGLIAAVGQVSINLELESNLALLP